MTVLLWLKTNMHSLIVAVYVWITELQFSQQMQRPDFALTLHLITSLNNVIWVTGWTTEEKQFNSPAGSKEFDFLQCLQTDSGTSSDY
jgi:hypothetical protein